MKRIRINDYREIKPQGETVLVLGYFDGIHLGHKALLDRARAIADQRGLTVTVLTFPESPQLAFARFRPDLLRHLTSVERRYQLFEQYGVDQLYLTDFTSEFAMNPPQAFVDHYIKTLQARVVVVGFDYHFGNSRATVADLKEIFDGEVEVVGEVQLGGEKISSTRIRQAIQEGRVSEANQLLGYPFETRGIVVHGDARGRTIGYPTANLAPIDAVHLPGDGVYVADVDIAGKRYRAMASVGKNITFDGTELRLEAHIFGFERYIYGENITIYWLEKIREMIKFDGIDALMLQMKEDERTALTWKEDD
ncbi:bifunctional riboflavin kinase/FAD synthetase [Streptococcus acidominimus]|uniref:Riboflavin biosynthesis protein n=1 Tax=Streptococcus acidominimus TaxID=1326 RepID=A0A4Y9FQ21_STRAI|nr:bifunctional riboflavin kinase/FAD synthetase [Streptococcus acidominimus]MBF0818383.1 bifunctional riboflavin kinase/FAD synthetase [Streptococcus acidominimus]MBF0838978.1 bifunctional riboflavin kinase/FAD synthetase [Streptococcus acidominimus]MBF0846898.1 bifunctional riboflavin kinase/FAD synthetase [Streptococcus danieliae]TFU31325.1 bifunctional riboflavin kinase/FAD synthetase [Streptococcus acidominimus]